MTHLIEYTKEKIKEGKELIKNRKGENVQCEGIRKKGIFFLCLIVNSLLKKVIMMMTIIIISY